MTTKSQAKAADITALLKARNPLLWVVTTEEARVEKYLFEAAAEAKYMTRAWDVAAGITSIDGTPDRAFPNSDDPDGALDLIREQAGSPETPNRNVFIMRDLPSWLGPPAGLLTLRRLRNLVRWLPNQPRHSAQAIIVISPSAEVPSELKNHATVIDWPLPDREEIAALLDATVASLPEDVRKGAVNGQRDAAIDAAVGLSGEEAQATFAKSLVQSKRIDPATIAAEKQQAIRGSGLEWLTPLPGGMEAVGGLDQWKIWVTARSSAYSPAAREYGLPAPKGALLLGVPGCGKTLSAKALAAEWQVPLIKLDLNALKGKYVGQSEASIRQAFNTIEAIGRCVIVIDEIEKALAGASGEAGDGGVSADALGALLSWMNDRTSEAFVVATANAVDKLPPELLRKGRFDEVFWVGLPNDVERQGVVAAALRSHGRNADTIGIDLEAVASATHQFSGAEIAALIPESMFVAFNEGAREITTEDIVAAAKLVKPKGSDKQRPDFAREATSTATTAPKGKGKGSERQLDF